MKALRLLIVIGLLAVSTQLPAKGQAVPDLGLRDFSGQPAGLDKYVGKGKWVLVMFWGLNCPICERNKPDINAFHDAHKDKDAEVVGVVINGMESKAAIEKAIQRHPLTFPNYIAELGLMAMNFQIAAEEPFRGTPTYWLFNPKGELVAVNPGPIRKEALENFIATH